MTRRSHHGSYAVLPLLEDYRESKCDIHRFALTPARLPFRGTGHDTDSFFVKCRMYSTQNRNIGYATICPDGELKGNPTLYAFFLAYFRIDKP